MKKLIGLALALALLLSLAACGAKGKVPEEKNIYSDLEPATLICADSTVEGSAGQLFGKYFAQRVLDITEGKLTVDYRPNGALGGDLDLIGKMRTNEIQIVICQPAPLVSAVPEAAVFDLPVVFSEADGDRIDAVLNGENAFTAKLSAAYEAAGLHLLGFLQNGTYRLTTSNRPLAALDDFKGLRIRTMENSNHMAFWAALGAEPTPLPWAQVYDALKDGRVDAQENAADTISGASLQDVQKYLARTDHILYCNQICIGKAAWDALDPIYQAAIAQAVSEAIAYMRPLMEEVDAHHRQKLVDSGMQLIEYDKAFFDSILALDGVQALFVDIDKNQVHGLGNALFEELRK